MEASLWDFRMKGNFIRTPSTAFLSEASRGHTDPEDRHKACAAGPAGVTELRTSSAAAKVLTQKRFGRGIQ